MSMYKKMKETSSPIFIRLEIQKLANVTSTSKISLNLRQNTRMWLEHRQTWHVICGSIQCHDCLYNVRCRSWFLVNTSWLLVITSWFLVNTSWLLVIRSWLLVITSWTLVRTSCYNTLYNELVSRNNELASRHYELDSRLNELFSR